MRSALSIAAAVAIGFTSLSAQERAGWFGPSNGGAKPEFVRHALPAPTFSLGDVGPETTAQPSSRAPEDKIHAELRAQIARGSAGKRVRAVIEFADDLAMPAFPQRDRTKPISDPVNQRVLRQRNELSERILAQRAERATARDAALRAGGITILERFWITNSLLVEMPLAAVTELANRADVVSLQPENSRERPPTVYDGRQLIRSDYIASFAQSHSNYVLIGLLDTGTAVNAQNIVTHALFEPPYTISGSDCVNGTTANCASGYNLNPADDCWNHGIRSSGILTGNDALGEDFRGVTNFTVYSYKVYSQNGSGSDCEFSPTGAQLGLDYAAAQRALQAAINFANDVIVVEIAAGKGSVLTTAADNAFDAGSAVIAAAGNNGTAGSIASPAEAHKAIAVGAIDYFTLTQKGYQSLGPEPDGRTKPDIQGPTDTYTASNAHYTAIDMYGGTSGSTPYGGAAAAFLSYWLSSYGVAPGHIYAQLINWGRNFTDPTSNNTSGAGLLAMQNGLADNWWGVVTLGSGQSIDIPMSVSGTCCSAPRDIAASIWWPEPATLHNNIDLRLVDPAGTVVRSSRSINSVFEKLQQSGIVAAGNWRLRITGRTVTGTQQVFYAAYVKKEAWVQ